MIFISELVYSLHLGSDKNKKNVSREKAKTNNSGTTSLPNSTIQNTSLLTRVDKDKLLNYIDNVNDTNNDYKNMKRLSNTLNNVDKKPKNGKKIIKYY